jgi:hypothetical protein
VGALERFGPTSLASGIAARNLQKQAAASSRLTSGGAVVAWSNGSELVLQRIDATGNPVGSVQSVGTLAATDFQVNSNFAVAATADGGWVVAWASSEQMLQFRRYDSSGSPLGSATAVDPAAFAQVTTVQIESLAGGGFVIGWTAREGSTTAQTRGFLRLFTAEGAAIGDRSALSSSPGEQSSLALTVLPDGTFLAAWVQGDASGTLPLAVVRRFDAALNPLGSETTWGLLASPPNAPSHVAAVSHANGTTLVAWGQNSDVHWQLVGTDGVAVGPIGSAAVQLSNIVDTIEVVPAASGFTVVVGSTFASNRTSTGSVTVLELDAAGVLSGRSELGTRPLWSANPFTGVGCGPAATGVAVTGGADGRYLLAYESCSTGATLELLGR